MTAVEVRGWIPGDTTYGARLALIRHRMKWNVKEAAREVGVPAASWRSWEDGAAPRNIVEVSVRITERTGCDLGWLLDPRRLAQGQDRGAINGHWSPSPATPVSAAPARRTRPADKRPAGRMRSPVPPAIAGRRPVQLMALNG